MSDLLEKLRGIAEVKPPGFASLEGRMAAKAKREGALWAALPAIIAALEQAEENARLRRAVEAGWEISAWPTVDGESLVYDAIKGCTGIGSDPEERFYALPALLDAIAQAEAEEVERG